MTAPDSTTQLKQASLFINIQAGFLVVVGGLISFISLISGSILVSLSLFLIFVALAALLVWAGRSLQRRSRRGAIVVLVFTIIFTLDAIALYPVWLVALPGCVASYWIVKNWGEMGNGSIVDP